MTDRAYRLVLVAFVTLCLFGLATHVQLLWDRTFSPWALPIALVLAAGWIAVCRGPRLALEDPRPVQPRWVFAAIAVVAVVTVAITHGAIATPARHWDGIVAWEIKADFLTRDPSLKQDFFAQPGVFCHSRDYPLLQPITIATGNRLLGAGLGRGLFGLLFVLLVATVGVTVRARARHGWLGPAIAIAIAVTPALVNPSMGGADSGFAELALATCLAGIAAGLALRRPMLLAAALFSSLLFKPEALLYGAIPVAITWCVAERALLRAALAAWLGAAALWLPLQHQIQHFWQEPPAHTFVWITLTGIGVVIAGSDAWLRRRRVTIRTRTIVAAVSAPLALAALPGLAFALGDSDSTANVYLQDLARPWERLLRLPEIAWGMLDHAWLRLGFALAFVIPVVLVFVKRRSDDNRLPAALLACGLASLFLPFLLSPEDDLRHHLRSSMTRLLIHWLGPAWIVSGLWLGQTLRSIQDSSSQDNSSAMRSAARPSP